MSRGFWRLTAAVLLAAVALMAGLSVGHAHGLTGRSGIDGPGTGDCLACALGHLTTAATEPSVEILPALECCDAIAEAASPHPACRTRPTCPSRAPPRG